MRREDFTRSVSPTTPVFPLIDALGKRSQSSEPRTKSTSNRASKVRRRIEWGSIARALRNYTAKLPLRGRRDWNPLHTVVFLDEGPNCRLRHATLRHFAKQRRQGSTDRGNNHIMLSSSFYLHIVSTSAQFESVIVVTHVLASERPCIHIMMGKN
jgi:hypothetical protein